MWLFRAVPGHETGAAAADLRSLLAGPEIAAVPPPPPPWAAPLLPEPGVSYYHHDRPRYYWPRILIRPRTG
jgi:hypothetical protein